MINLTLNGQEITYAGNGKETLLNWLRLSQKIKSTKDGCSQEGTCGACLVEINKKAKSSCSILMEKLDGASIVTLEGVSEEIKSTLGKAFVASGATQCGFCTPGLIMRANVLLHKKNHPSRKEVTNAIKLNLCRCTGYVKVVDAILLASEKLKHKETVHFESMDVGKSAPKYQALERALGAPLFMDDLEIDDMLFGVLCFSEHPRAKIVKLDTSKAEAIAGVIKVLTAKDIPGTRDLGLNVKDWPAYIAEGEITAYIGDVLACVVAESEAIARKAVDAIQLEYEVYEPLTDPEVALTSDIKLGKNGNILKEVNVCYGEEIGKVFADSAFVVSGTFETQMIEHAYLETESSVALYEDNKLTVYSQSQAIFREREQIASILGLEKEQVNIKFVPTGGAFGGKLNTTVQIHSALAAYHLKQPVKVKLNRFESFRMHPKKHPMTMNYQLGCDKDGKFTGLYARILADSGAYASQGIPVIIKAAAHAGGAYFIPNVKVNAKAVYTNNLISGAMRGFGVSQVTFAIEGLIDDLCEKSGFDRWELRYKNVLEQNLTTTGGDTLRKEVGLKQALEILKKHYDGAKFSGIACAIKNCGIGSGHPEVSQVKLEVLPNGKIRLYHGWNEIGQGIDTILQQLLHESLKTDELLEIEIIVATEHEMLGGGTVGSRGTFLSGNSLLEAAKHLKADMDEHGGLSALVGKSYQGKYVGPKTTTINSLGEEKHYFAYGFAAHLVILSDEGKVEKIIAVHDSGRVLNKNLYEGQVEGGIVMGLGWTLSENLILDKGQIVNSKFNELGLLRSTDVPKIKVIPIEIDDLDGPMGAKGVGEIMAIPVAPAVASAYRSFDGQKRAKLPLEPIKPQNKS
jgi:selenium-dependent xanthine dehydrogenase